MGCCGVPRITDPETYLRLACERILLAQGRNNRMQGDAEPTVISRASLAAGTLDQATANAVLDEYALAMALRDRNRGHMLRHRRSVRRSEGQRLSAQRVAVCDCDFERGNQRWTLERVLFADDATHLDLSGTDPAGSRGNPRRRGGRVRSVPGVMPHQPHPQTLALADDQGTTATGRVGASSWGGGSWESSYRTDVPLSPDTWWIELDGTRIELPERQPAPEVHLEEIEPIDPLRAMLYGEILSTDRRHGSEDTVEIACRTLVAIGALGEDDPMLLEIRRIADAVAGAAPIPGLSEPWASLLARYSKGDGLTGRLAIGAVIDDLDGFSVRLDALVCETGSFSISLAMSPGTPLLPHFPGFDVKRSPITWWAEDDRKNAYVAFSDQGGGSEDLAEGQVTSLASLDPKATELRLLPTASRTRAVITLPLAALADHT
jgi:hypothetical protein